MLVRPQRQMFLYPFEKEVNNSLRAAKKEKNIYISSTLSVLTLFFP